VEKSSTLTGRGNVSPAARLEGIVRKGKSVSRTKSVSKIKAPQRDTLVTGRGIVSPAMQLAERFEYSKSTMIRRFKQWATSTALKLIEIVS
jgi:hypothetical protein